MKKILFTATVDSHIINFHIPFIKLLAEKGYKIHVASNGNSKVPYASIKYNIPFNRNPFNLINIKAFSELIKLIKENDYELIHCHTPIASVITRLAAKGKRKSVTTVMYTAHGFHFYQGAPLKNWILYYPVEKWLSKYTDCLITINKEDFNIAKNRKFKAKELKLVNGVGIDLNKYRPINDNEKEELRNKHGFNKDDFILIYPAEMNKNKNQLLLIKVIKLLTNKIPKLKLILAGNGESLEDYKKIVNDKGLSDNIIFPGFRSDIDDFFKIADVSVASSIREGLPLNILEAMACGLPIVATYNRGHNELIKNKYNGFLVDVDDDKGFAKAVNKLYSDKSLRKQFGINSKKIVQKYSIDNILNEMGSIYNNYLK